VDPTIVPAADPQDVHRRATHDGRAPHHARSLYQFPREALSETRNATVHGFVCTALARTASGYRL